MYVRFLMVLFGLGLTVSAARASLPFNVEVIATFSKPWSLAFLPDGRMLVTEKAGRLLLVAQNGEAVAVAGVPAVDYGGQGGFGDVVLHPEFERNALVYLSYAEAGAGDTRGAAVARGVLDLAQTAPVLRDVEVIWRQYPKVLGRGHYGHRLLFDEDGFLWISSGDRQKFTPAQDMQANLGKLLRLHDDGSIPGDNPFTDYIKRDPLVDDEAVYGQFWAIGLRNPLGIAFDLQGRLWEIEMGPAGGDELNLVERGANYGYPLVSNGDHYDGREIPDHATRPEFAAPSITWTPVISPADLMVYRGEAFSQWRGNALAAGLSSQSIVRIALEADGAARELERFAMGARIRSLEEGPQGAIWALEDERGDSRGRLLKLTPVD